MEVINLRSDTGTLPTAQMLRAIAEAPLGDDTYGEDPTCARLQAMAAERMGKEAALLVPSGHMGNLVALMVHAGPGDAVVLDAESHICWYETGSMASLAGVMPHPLPSTGGRLDPDAVAAAVRPDDVHYARTRLLCLENSHNRSGGRAIPLDLHQRLCTVAHDAGLAVHLDGARIFNAAIATGHDVTAFADTVDSLMFCLSKGLSCPLGSLLVGTRDFIEEATHVRRRLGGGLRQAGVIAAPGIVALTTMVDRLAEDHAHARQLAEGLAAAGLAVDVDTVDTNMVLVGTNGLATDVAMERLASHGVLGGPREPDLIRLVTNRHHDTAMIDEAIRRITAALC